jgi:hypothetical protein
VTQSWDPNTGAQPGDPSGGYNPAGYSGQPGQAGYPGQPGYPAGGYPGQPAQPAYGQPAYGPPPGYPPGYGDYPPAPVANRRPGAVTAAAVLAFVQAGLVIVAGIVLLSGGTSMIDYGGQVSGLGTEWTIVAIITIICGGVILAGGVQLFKGKAALVVIGSALSLLISVYWVIRISSFDVNIGPALVWPLIFAVLPVITLALALGSSSKAWSRQNA